MFILALPWFLIALFLVEVLLVWKKKWVMVLILAVALFLLNWWSDCFCFGHNTGFEGELKVLCFNVKGSGQYDESKTSNIVELIFEENPDVVFLTENFPPIRDSLLVRLQMRYPFDTRYIAHNLFLSKYPLDNQVFYENLNGGSGYIVRCSVSIGGKDVSLYGCHLSSNNYSSELDYLTPGNIDTVEETTKYLSNVKNDAHLRALEAETITGSISEGESVIVMGDMNDICGSTCLNMFKDSALKDAWSVGGLGYGATIHHPLPYRIDHILFNDKLKLRGIKKKDTREISDHDALVAVFDLK